MKVVYKKIKFSHRVISVAAALSMMLPLCAPIMYADAAAPVAVSSAAHSRTLKDELSKNGNLVTEYVNQEDNRAKTILWVKGIDPPKMGGPDNEFKREQSTVGNDTFVTYQAPYRPNCGWYDVNKTGAGDINLCFAAAAANSLHWWMDRNGHYIDRYLEKNPDDSQIQRLSSLRHSFQSQSKSDVFDIFLKQFANRQEGYWPDLLQDQFINGYYLHSGGGTNDRPMYADKVNNKGPDKHGGFFNKVFGTDLLSARRLYDQGYDAIGRDLKECFMRGDIVLMSFRVSHVQSHVVTLWGAEYDQNGNLSGVYYTDSDDQPHIGMQRYKVINVNGKAVVSTRLENVGTNAIECLLILSPGTAQWDKYFENDKKTLDLVWSNTEHTYDGKPHTPTVKATNLAPGEQVELIVEGEGTDVGSYTATAAFKDGQNAKYKLPEQPTCQFQIKKAAAPVISYPDASDLQYGELLNDSTLTGGSLEYGSFVWANGGTLPAAGAHSYPMVFVPSYATQQNYEPVQNTEAQVPVKVTKSVPQITIDAQVEGKADAIQVNLSAGVHSVGLGETPSGSVSFTITDENGQSVAGSPVKATLDRYGTATAVWKPTESKRYTVKAAYAGNANYESASTEMPINIPQQSQKPIVIHPIEAKTYGDGSFQILAEGGSGSGAFTFSSSAPDVISVNNNTATIHKAGTAVITVTKAADGVFAPAEASVPVTVAKKALTVTAENKLNVLQGAQMPTFTYKVKGLVNGDQFANPVLTAALQDTNTPGDYKITIKGGQLTNAESYTVTYVDGKLTILPKEVPPTTVPTPEPTKPMAPTTKPTKPTTPTTEPSTPAPTPTPESTPTEPAENPFQDVSPTEYYYEPVLWAVNNGITSGVRPDEFGSNLNCTRGQIATFLWAAAGKPEPKSTSNPFTDVTKDDYYYKAVLWAVENKITSGISANRFGPNQVCTRAQTVTFLWAAEGKPTVESSASFSDVASGSYYYDAVNWAVENKVTAGVSADRFGPSQDCLRGQIVTFLYKTFA